MRWPEPEDHPMALSRPAPRPMTPDPSPGENIPVVPKHHVLVRWSHWVNVPLLFGLIASGLSIYWAAPVFLHPRDPVTGSREYLGDLGVLIARVLHDRSGTPRFWIYDHLSLGPQSLATGLRFHWA